MADLPLDVRNYLARIGLVPVPIKLLGHHPELDDEIVGQVLWFGLAALLTPQARQRNFIVAHDDPGVRTANEGAAGPDGD